MGCARGTILSGRYEVDEFVAEGGTSVIYRGHPLNGAGLVAIKELQVAADPVDHRDNVRHFYREYEFLKALSHPSLPLMLDILEVNGSHYIIEEYLPGETLQALIEREHKLNCHAALAIALQLLDVLNYLHQHGIIYRDLKPANVLIMKSGTPRLIDFGAARRWKPKARGDTVALGTPGYAAPEQYGRAQSDARSDLYSVGVLLHQMVTGHDPTEREPWSFQVPRSVEPDVPEPLSHAIMMALNLDPERRYASAREMQDALTSPLAISPTALARLRTFRKKLQYTYESDYRDAFQPAQTVKWWFTVAMSLLVFLPVAGWARLVQAIEYSPYGVWKRCKGLAITLYDEGLLITDVSSKEICWDDVSMVTVSENSVDGRPVKVKLSTRKGDIVLQTPWPGLVHLVEFVLTHARLVLLPSQSHTFELICGRFCTCISRSYRRVP